MKKTLLALALMLALLATCLVGCGMLPGGNGDGENQLMDSASAVFTLDVNPGVRIYVKEDNTVIAVEATNEDGEEVVAELELEGVDYETVVERIIDAMNDLGYITGEESSVLVSVEKKVMDISEKINEKIEKTFEKHGKRASVIEQELDKLNEDVEKVIGEMAEKYNISEGKAHLIEKIREEFPELSEEELAQLKVNELRMMLEDTSDAVKEHFNKLGEAIEEAYIGREAALEAAVASLENAEITVENIEMHRVRVTREDGKMIYEVEFVYGGMEYEIEIDAESGEILSTESEEFEEFDPEKLIDDFCDKHSINPEEIKDKIIEGIFGKGEEMDDHEQGEEKPMTRGEIIRAILSQLNIAEDSLKRTDVKVYETESGIVCSVTIETNEGDVYELAVEAYSGAVITAELNGTEIDLFAEKAE